MTSEVQRNSGRTRPDTDIIEVDLSQVLMTLRKHRWMIFIVTCLSTVLAACYVQFTTPLYTGKATLLLDRELKGVPGLEELYGVSSGGKEYFQTQYEILKSRELAERVVDELDLTANASFNNVPASPIAAFVSGMAGEFQFVSNALAAVTGAADSMNQQAPSDNRTVELPTFLEGRGDDTRLKAYDAAFLDTLTRLTAGLDVEAVPRTKLIELSFTSHEPQLAAYIPNAMGVIYVESQQDNRNSETDKQSEWLVERLTSLEAQLQDSEARLQSFKKTNRLVDIDGEVTRFSEQELLNLSSKLLDSERELAESKALYEQVQRFQSLQTLERQRELENIPPVQSSEVITAYKIERSMIERELDELSTRYGEKHPRILDAGARYAVIQRNIELEVERVVGAIVTSYGLNQEHVSSLRRAVNNGRRQIEDIGEKSFELSQLQREVDANRNLYETLFSRYRETNETRSLEQANAQVVQQAVVPLEPSDPNKKLILTLAFVVSLVGSALVALLREIFDSSIDTIGGLEKIESKLGVPLVGIVPLRKDHRRGLPLDPSSIESETDSVFCESIRRVASSIMVGPDRASDRVVLVSSSVPNEGKSTTALNLAFELSKTENVLLVDADLRKPTVHRVLGPKIHIEGLADILSGSADLNTAISQNAVGSLDVLSAGSERSGAQLLLTTDNLAVVFDALRETYDRIIVDTPPIHAVSDVLHLSTVCDSVIYAVKSNDTEMKLVEKGIAQFASVETRIHGIVVTMVDIDKAKAYGGHYYSGYYDYYGYA